MAVLCSDRPYITCKTENANITVVLDEAIRVVCVWAQAEPLDGSALVFLLVQQVHCTSFLFIKSSPCGNIRSSDKVIRFESWLMDCIPLSQLESIRSSVRRESVVAGADDAQKIFKNTHKPFHPCLSVKTNRKSMDQCLPRTMERRKG